MSERAAARGLALAALGRGERGFARDHRYLSPAERAAGPGDAVPDPVAEAYARGYAEGAAAGRAAAMAEAAAGDAARQRIETALARLDADHVDAFAGRLRDTVLALCDAVLAEAALAPEALGRRVARAAAMFARADDDRVIRLHPDDLVLLHGRLPDHWHCEPDGALERGAVRVETAQGGVEDGPAQWRAALAEALAA